MHVYWYLTVVFRHAWQEVLRLYTKCHLLLENLLAQVTLTVEALARVLCPKVCLVATCRLTSA